MPIDSQGNIYNQHSAVLGMVTEFAQSFSLASGGQDPNPGSAAPTTPDPQPYAGFSLPKTVQAYTQRLSSFHDHLVTLELVQIKIRLSFLYHCHC